MNSDAHDFRPNHHPKSFHQRQSSASQLFRPRLPSIFASKHLVRRHKSICLFAVEATLSNPCAHLSLNPTAHPINITKMRTTLPTAAIPMESLCPHTPGTLEAQPIDEELTVAGENLPRSGGNFRVQFDRGLSSSGKDNIIMGLIIVGRILLRGLSYIAIALLGLGVGILMLAFIVVFMYGALMWIKVAGYLLGIVDYEVVTKMSWWN
ncbi:hypothetical protein SCUP515_01736 [Seiridium cupressi]